MATGKGFAMSELQAEQARAKALTTTQPEPIELGAHERALVMGDLSSLSGEERLALYKATCAAAGLNPVLRPFEYIRTREGGIKLYAMKSATEQLRKLHRVSLEIMSRDATNGVLMVTARARTPDGRVDESIGAVPIEGLKGEALANAVMKAETKAKRRVTLSICGLGMLDESEVDSVPGAHRIVVDEQTGEILREDPPPQRPEPAPTPALPPQSDPTLEHYARLEQRIRDSVCEADLKDAWAIVSAHARAGKIGIEQRAQLAALKDQQKKLIAEMTRLQAEAQTRADEASLEVGADPWGLVGKGGGTP